MPVSNQDADGLADPILGIYTDAERLLLERIARALGQGLDAPDWAERKLAELRLLIARVKGDLDKLTDRSVDAIVEAIVTAWGRGEAIATWDTKDLLATVAAGKDPAWLPAVQALVGETVATVTGANTAILRAVDDAYRAAVSRADAQVLLGVLTRREAAQLVLDDLATRGISGFIDSRGRRWDMASYAEMSVRSATARATLDAHTAKLLDLGHDLVQVSDSPAECPLCRPWEGKVLSLTGIPHVDVPVAGTLEQARAAGLMHPNCTHRLGAYFHGVTEPMHDTANPEGYEARQQQRYIERRIREWKRREAVALDEGARKKAHAKVLDWQARARENVADTGTKRLSYREQVGKAH
ncbi:hypothetical protein GCM10009785_01500 [Brooklawnia cerclae]|uniref:Minor capsid protein n=1 Tax=Brooklawnia cerclae TaxID=349934 RepID=A0ABX0SHL7_9ACTN|nr:hypothetical protein [Brooklawnia cerclae]